MAITGNTRARLDRSELLADMICEALAEAPTRGMSGVCDELGISRLSVYAWERDDADFAAKLAAARAAQIERMIENSQMTLEGVEGFTTRDTKRDVAIAKRIDWLASKWHRRRYGEKLEIESTNRTATIPISDDPNEAARQYQDMMRR